MVKCNRPWRPPPSYGRYGAALPATKHATINLSPYRVVDPYGSTNLNSDYDAGRFDLVN